MQNVIIVKQKRKSFLLSTNAKHNSIYLNKIHKREGTGGGVVMKKYSEINYVVFVLN